jgi:hypothetical protein
MSTCEDGSGVHSHYVDLRYGWAVCHCRDCGQAHWIERMPGMAQEPLEPLILGPIPYFSAPVIYFGRCPLGDYDTGKVASEREARRMTREHIDAKHVPRAAAAAGR